MFESARPDVVAALTRAGYPARLVDEKWVLLRHPPTPKAPATAIARIWFDTPRRIAERVVEKLAAWCSQYSECVARLVVEGSGGGADQSALNEVLEKAYGLGVRVVPSANRAWTMKYVLYMASLAVRGQRKGEPRLAPPAPKDASPEELALHLLSGVAGPKTAEKLLEAFGSPARVFTASQEELEKVVGRAKAAWIRLVAEARAEECGW